MPIHDFAFWVSAFFLLGVFSISISGQFWAIFLIAVLVSLYFVVFKKWRPAFLILFVIAGAFYYQIFDYSRQKDFNAPFDSQLEFSGVIKKIIQTVSKQDIVLSLNSPYGGNIKINARRYPNFQYGDLVRVTGVIKQPPLGSRDYFDKEGIAGIASFPKIELIESGHGNKIKELLLGFKTKITDTFKKVLPVQKAAFLAGITLGEREGFSKEFEEKMAVSGTIHLVALSGYNISIITLLTASIFSFYFSRAISFYLSVLIIILFVLMTGAEASVVRAAIMGIIAILSKKTERLFSMRNAIIIAAFLMVLYNPKILAFDLGFQLSFAALLGIVYLLPPLKKFFKWENPGFLFWKENTLVTLSAQLAVIPLLLAAFGKFSLLSLVSNVLIGWTVPLTMGLGFIMAGLGFLSEFLAGVVGLAVNLLLAYEFLIIDLFSRISLPIVAESFSFLATAAYYALLIGFIYKFNK